MSIRKIGFFEKLARNTLAMPLVILRFLGMSGRILGGLICIGCIIAGVFCALDGETFINNYSTGFGIGAAVSAVVAAISWWLFIAMDKLCDKIQVKNVCPKCNMNNGIYVANEELVHEGRWRRVENPGYVVDIQENTYNVTYCCSNCGYGYTIQQTRENRKRV